MKKLLYTLAFLFVIASIFGWLLLTPATQFNTRLKYIYVMPGKDAKAQVLQQLDTAHLLSHPSVFSFMAGAMNVWQSIKPGRFEIKSGQNLLSIIRIFQKNRQSPVVLNIGRIRTNESLARLIGKNFSTDSLSAISFFNTPASLQKFGVDSNTLLSLIIPGTYVFKWETKLDSVLSRFKGVKDSFWLAGNRMQKAAALGLSPLQVCILASIVEEETNKDEEKGNIASVYINRLNKNIALGADPTIKFALKDFSLKRILYAYLSVNSPYNTYRNKGLPPGPICTPTKVTIDAVLNAPKTGYLFFVAKSDFSGYHHFSTTFAEHQQYAKEYQDALNALLTQKQNENP